MEKNLQVSRHAKQRIKERCGIGKSNAERYCRLAIERGTDMKNTKGPLRKWLDKRSRGREDIIIWGDKAFIVSKQNIVITCLQIPSELTRNMKSMIITA